MRNSGFVARHRGGKLSPEDHRLLMVWAISCFERLAELYGKELDPPLMNAITVARGWARQQATTGDAMKASRAVHAFARTMEDPVLIAIARAIGHGVATAHMADHCMGAALYALKALKFAGKSIEAEQEWQIQELDKLSVDLAFLVKTTMQEKAKGLGLYR